jgi:hypothetical protein
MTVNKPNNKSKWTAAGAAAKTAEPAKTAETTKSAPEAPAPAAAKTAPVAPSVKSEPVAPAPAQQVPLESAAVDEAVIAAALAPQAPEAPAFVEIVELEAAPVLAAQESVAGFAISASAPIATPEAAAWAFKSVELWSENAQAMMGFASALGKAKSLTEVVELQSRFATERFNRFAKLAGEVVPPPKFFFFAA